MHKYGIEVTDVCHKYVLHDLKEWTGNAPRRSVYIVPVLRPARVVKQNMSWVVQISSSSCRMSTSRWAWMMAGCMVWVD
jgi:hypothetical protein